MLGPKGWLYNIHTYMYIYMHIYIIVIPRVHGFYVIYNPEGPGLSKHSKDTTKGPRDYKERRIYWTSGITSLELSYTHWTARQVTVQMNKPVTLIATTKLTW